MVLKIFTPSMSYFSTFLNFSKLMSVPKTGVPNIFDKYYINCMKTCHHKKIKIKRSKKRFGATWLP